MRHLVLLASFAALAGCTFLKPGPEQSKSAPQGAERTKVSNDLEDSHCYSDCMSDQASEQLCRQRCTY